MPNDKKLNLCRKYYMAGFALLPFMWAVNALWFMREAFWAPPYPEQKQIRRYVVVSGVGALLWLLRVAGAGSHRSAGKGTAHGSKVKKHRVPGCHSPLTTQHLTGTGRGSAVCAVCCICASCCGQLNTTTTTAHTPAALRVPCLPQAPTPLP
ncbi:hypothetical protein O3P69_009403 [Scylla paramamosain]|uniref:Gamma-secretase subunit PEN-2 n=1 Tax=Scylla paramamosain TaxID=85552 RepID=A0AAW0SVE4_SCYPA